TTVGIAAGGKFTSTKSSRGVCARFSCVVLLLSRKSRLGTSYRLTTLFTDSDESNMSGSHRLLAEERYLPRSTCASRTAAELVQVAAIANRANTRTNHRIFSSAPTRLAKKPTDRRPPKERGGLGFSQQKVSR